MMKSWLRIMLVGLCVAAVAGPLLSTADAATASYKKPACAHKKAGTQKHATCVHKKVKGGPRKTATVGAGGVSTGTWMHDLAPHLWYRRLSDIVIPGTHDSTTYSLGDPSDIAVSQDEDLTHQLGDGVREFDIRVAWEHTAQNGWGYYSEHGIRFSTWLKLPSILTSIDQWALAPGHEQEIIVLKLSITQSNGGPFPTSDCQNFAATLGDALVTPDELLDHFGTTDPGQVTLGQLWSLPDPKGAARVIMDNDQCMDALDSSVWGPFPAAGQNLVSGYYADQCTADPVPASGDLKQLWGIKRMVLAAVKTRATQGTGSEPIPVGSPTVGGLYELDIQGTPEFDCLVTPHSMISDEQEVLAALYNRWQTDAVTRQNLNIVAGDYIEYSGIVAAALAMDESYPGIPNALTRVGNEHVVAPQGSFAIPASAFAALASYRGAATPGASVTYQISPATPGVGFGEDQPYPTVTVAADAQGDVNPGDLLFPEFSGITGTWTVTASAGGGTASWTVVVAPATGLHLKAVPCDAALVGYPCHPSTVGVTNDYTEDDRNPDLSFTVAAVDKSGHAVPGVPVTFDAGSAGTFPGGSSSVTVNTEDYLFKNRAAAPVFTAGTRAGTFPISVTSPQADDTLTLPFTITPDSPASFVVTKGNGQATQINTKFPIALQGHWVDQYGNVVTDPPTADRLLRTSGDGTWPNGYSSVEATVNADGTLTAPILTAGHQVLAGPDAAHSLIVQAGPAASGWTLQVLPGPAAKVTAAGGDGQHTAAGTPFPQTLAVKVIDAGDNPIPGYPVTFTVTSGAAAFAPVNLPLAATVTGRPALLHQADPPRDTVLVLTNDQGVATAPVLTAAERAGPIVVTASVGVSPAVEQAVFHLSADRVAPTAPTIDGLTNGDGQASVAFSGASAGSAPITSYTVRAIDENHATAPPVAATGPSSPVTVKGLTNGDPYVFTVSAASADGTSPPSAPSGRLNVGVAPVIGNGPANGTVGQAYSSGFTVTGAPAPTVTFISGQVPPGLTPGSGGALTGTPTQAGSYQFTVQATNPVGIYSATVTVAISAAMLGAAPPVPGGRSLQATICTIRAGQVSACVVRTVSGNFPPLEASAAATLVGGSVTYAIGRATAHYRKLTLSRQRQIPAGSYTLILRRPGRAIFAPVTVR